MSCLKGAEHTVYLSNSRSRIVLISAKMSESGLRRSIASRKAHMGIITRKKGEFENIRMKLVDEITSEDKLIVETLLESLEEKARVLDQLNLEILNGTENTQALEAEIFTQDENDVRLKSLMKQMRKWLAGLSDSTDDDDGSIHRENNVRLPRIELPTFDGQYKDWKSFFDMFKGTVHDHPTLPKVQKLFYLKGALKSDAKRVLSHLPTTEANYDAAIKLLQDRYDNQFLITKAHLTNIMKIENMRKEGPDSLRKLIGTFNENEMALSALGIDTKACDFIWVHILSEKLDNETAKEWQLTNVDGKMKTMDDLRQFLERRARALEASIRQPEMKREALGNKDIDIRNKSEHCQSYQSTSMICSFCKQSHRIYTTHVPSSSFFQLLTNRRSNS